MVVSGQEKNNCPDVVVTYLSIRRQSDPKAPSRTTVCAGFKRKGQQFVSECGHESSWVMIV